MIIVTSSCMLPGEGSLAALNENTEATGEQGKLSQCTKGLSITDSDTRYGLLYLILSSPL